MTPTPRSNSKSPPWSQGDEDATSFGTWLRQQREMREITLREISDASKISLRYLEAFEQDRYDVLPSQIFSRGFLRQYARYVGLDGDEVLNRYLAAQQELEPEEEEQPSKKSSETHWLTIVLVVLLFAIAATVVALVGFNYERGRNAAPAEEAPAPASRPADSAGPEAGPERPGAGEPNNSLESEGGGETSGEAAPSGAPLNVTLNVVERCWARIEVDGQQESQGELAAGQQVALSAERYVVLNLGNAGGVEVEVNGRPYDLGGRPGQVLSRRIDLETARALENS